MFEFHLVRTGDGEPATCPRCATAGEHTSTFSDVRETLADLSAVFEHCGPVENVMFAGGEPLAIPGFRAAVESARAGGARRIGIRTSGVGLGEPAVALSLIEAGLRHVHVMAAGVASGVSGVDAGSLDPAITLGLKALEQAAAQAGVRLALCARVPVCSHNVEHLPQIVRSFAENGAEAVLLLAESGLDHRRAAPWVGAAFETGLVNAVWVAVEGIPADVLGPAAAATRGSIRFVREIV